MYAMPLHSHGACEMVVAAVGSCKDDDLASSHVRHKALI